MSNNDKFNTFKDVALNILESEQDMDFSDIFDTVFNTYRHCVIHDDINDTIINGLEETVHDLLDSHNELFEENCKTLYEVIVRLSRYSSLLLPIYVILGAINPSYKKIAEEQLDKSCTSENMILNSIEVLKALRAIGYISDSVYESYISSGIDETLSHMNFLMGNDGQGQSANKSISTVPSDDVELIFSKSMAIISDIYMKRYNGDGVRSNSYNDSAILRNIMDDVVTEITNRDSINYLVKDAIKSLCEDTATVMIDMVDENNMLGMIDVYKKIYQLMNAEKKNRLLNTLTQWVLLIIHELNKELSFKKVHDLLCVKFISNNNCEIGENYTVSKSRLVLKANSFHASILKIRQQYGMSVSTDNVSMNMIKDGNSEVMIAEESHEMTDNVVDVLDSIIESDFENDPTIGVRGMMESLSILPDGSIKVMIKKKTTFMDEYAENHRLLKSNEKLGDYESMKYNLVFCLILIDSIEKQVLYNDRIDKDSDAYKDALKAKNFAKNDLSVYLPIIKRHERNFDLNQFYSQVKADKATIEIDTVSAIRGIKQIVKAVAL